MEYIYLKETDQNLKELKELTKLIENNKIPSPLIVAEQYMSKFPDYTIRAEQLKQELIAFIYTFRPPIYIVEKYIEVVEAIKKFIGKNAVRTLPPLYDERFDADGTYRKTSIIDITLPRKTREDLLKDVATKHAPFTHERFLCDIMKQHNLRPQLYPNGKDKSPDLRICDDISLEAKASLSKINEDGSYGYNNNNGTNNTITVAQQLRDLDPAIFNEIVVDSFYMPVYNEEMTTVENYWWGAIVNWMPLLLDISYNPQKNHYYLVTRSDGEKSKNNNAMLHPERYKTYRQYSKMQFLVNMINQERGYEIEPIIPFKEQECMDTINEKDVFLSENKKILREYKNTLSKKDLTADTSRNHHEATLLYELKTILANIQKSESLKILEKNIKKENYTTQTYMYLFKDFLKKLNENVDKDLAAVDDIIIGYLTNIKEIYINQVNFLYKELINDTDILFTTILATSKFNKKNKQSYNSSFNRILKNKKIFDELAVINSDYKYDFCHYNEVIAGIKSTLDTL